MSCVVELLRPRGRLQAIALVLIAAGAAGCSSETTRFNENPYGSKGGPGEVTGSVATAPAGRVESNQLPPPGGGRPATVATAPAPAPANSAGIAGGGRGMASFTPGSASGSDVTGSVQPAQPQRPPEHWSWDGGTAVTVAPGETVEGIAHRHNVPAAAVLSANNLAPNAAIYPGQRLVIPRRSQAATTSAAAAAPGAPAPTRIATTVAAKPQPAAPAKPAPATSIAAPPPATKAAPASASVHIVVAGDTLSKIARTHNKPLIDVLKVNNLAPNARLSIGDRVVIPGAQAAAAPAKDVANAIPAKPAAPAPKAPGKQASAEPTQVVNVVTPATDTSPAANAHGKTAEAASPTFRWPAKGRVIAGFGPKTNGQQNDGINLAVPEGTPIKAAEDGVVAYAGNELKGYGNLVLVRHSNGYVTAYAHAKELLVKRGDNIKRGQTIANSGQTGNVDAPQLHFEIRKGPAPVDPLPMLGGG